MPLPMKVWVIWMLLSAGVAVGSAVVNSVGNYSTKHWSFILNGYALGSAAIGAVALVLMICAVVVTS